MVAAFADADVGVVPGRKPQPPAIGPGLRVVVAEVEVRGGVIAAPRPDGLGHVVAIVNADQRVDLGDERAELLAVALHEAAGDNEPAELAAPLACRQFADYVQGFLARRTEEPAGVHDDRVRQ